MNYKNNFLIVLAILLGALMLISAASAADADIVVSDAPSIDQVTINQNEVTYNDSSAKSLNAVPTGDISVNAGSLDTTITASTSYVKNSDGTYNATITIELDRNNNKYPNGSVTVTCNGNPYSCDFTQGKKNMIGYTKSKATCTISGLVPGDYPVIISYSGDDNFAAKTVNYNLPQVTLTINGLDSTIYDDNYNSKESEKLTVNVLKKPTLNINLISIYLSDGTLYDDEVTVSVIASGTIFTVPKGTIFFSIDGGNTWANDTLSIVGTASYTFNNLSKGNYTVLVKYIGSNYDPTEANKTFEVSRYETTLTVTNLPTSITVGDNTLVTIIVADDKLLSIPTGKVYYSLDNNTWTEATMDIPFSFGSNLTEGNYTIYAKYDGDSHHFGSTGTTTLKVVRKSLDLTIDVEDCALDEDLVVKATTDKGFTGNLTFDVNGTVQSVEVVNGSANATFDGLCIGSYLVIVKYDGDTLYAPDSVNKTISVKSGKLNITSSLNTTSIREIDSVKVTATLSESVTGNISVLVDGNVINTTEIPDGDTNVEFILSNLTKGSHNICVCYEGNEYYLSKKSENVVLNVTRAPVKPNMDISIDGTLDILDIPIIDSNEVTIVVDLSYDNEPVLGNVRFSLDNGTTWTEYISLKNKTSGLIFKQHYGEANYTFADLEDGNHTVLVEYEGSYDYLPTNNTKTFQTFRYETSIDITIVSIDSKPLDKEIFVGNDAYAVVYIQSGLLPVSGNISYSFDNETWNTTSVSLIGAWIPLKDLKVGNYTLYVNYLGDNKYQESNGSIDFSIIKYDANWVITVYSVNLCGLFDLSLEDFFNGTLLNILNRSSEKDILNIILDSIIDKDLEYGDIPIVTVTDVDAQLVLGIPAPTGTMSFSLDGNKWYTEKVINLLNIPTASHIFALLSLDQLVLDAGNYTVYINYSGDKNYNAFNTTKNFTINKVNPDISITLIPERVIPTECAFFTVTLDGIKLTQIKNPKGNVSFSIDGGEWIDEDILPLLINSYSAHAFTNISEGSHTVTIRYNGDNNYNVVYANKTFEVTKAIPTLNIDVDEVIIGSVVNVRVALDDSEFWYEPTGNVSFKLDNGTWVTVPLIKIILDPHAYYTFNGVSVGNHTVFVRYNGNDYFFPVEGNKTFEVIKITPTLNIYVDNITYGEDATVIVSLDDSEFWYEPTGNVSFKLGDGEWITVPLKDIVIFDPYAYYTYEDLVAGDYTVYVKYNGDDYFFPVKDSAKFTVKCANPNLSIETENIVYGNNATIVATLPNNTEGTVTFILSNGDNVTVPVVNGSAIAVFEGLGAKRYNVLAIYSGDKNYTCAYAYDHFSVYKGIPDVSANASDIRYHNNATVIVTVPSDATGTVTVILDNGMNQTVDVVNGTATAIFEDLGAGTYYGNVRYNGNDNYTYVLDQFKFTVYKANPTIYVDVGPNKPVMTEIIEGDDVIVIVTLPEDATGIVGFSLDGGKTWVYANVINGTAKYVFKGLKAGEYNLLVRYFGDDNYNPVDANTTFVIEALPAPESPLTTMPNTGNPLLVLLIALAGLGLGSLKRKL